MSEICCCRSDIDLGRQSHISNILCHGETSAAPRAPLHRSIKRPPAAGLARTDAPAAAVRASRSDQSRAASGVGRSSHRP
jgi:hypothetical protein